MNLFPDKAGEKAAEDPTRREAIASFMVAVYGDNKVLLWWCRSQGRRAATDAPQTDDLFLAADLSYY